MGILRDCKVHILFISLITMFVLLCCSSQIQADQAGDYTYTITDGKATITHYSGAGGSVTIPSTLGGAAVTSVGDYAFAACTGLTSLTFNSETTTINNAPTTIPEGTTIRGYNSSTAEVYATNHNRTFESLDPPPTLLTAVSISGTAEEGQTLTAIVAPSGATVTYQWKAGGTEVGTNATYVVQAADVGKTITVTVTATEGYTGEITSALTSPVTAILITAKINDGSAISGFSLEGVIANSGQSLGTITSIEITGGTVTTADWQYISSKRNNLGLGGLISFKVAESVTAVADIPDSNGFPFSIKTVDIAKVKSIGKEAFWGCYFLVDANFPEVETIGSKVFYNCQSLETVKLPALTNISENAFANCQKIVTADFPLVTSVGISAFEGCSSLVKADFPLVISIGENAFGEYRYLDKSRNQYDTYAKCTSLREANFPLAETVGYYAFYGCTSLSEINFPRVTSIGNYAFYKCESLTEANFPKAATTGDSAFLQCTDLHTANFPVAVETGVGAFTSCTSLSTVNFPQVTKVSEGSFIACTSLKTADFPKATLIGYSAFYGCTSLTTINIPLVERIDDGTGIGAFAGCSSLTTIRLPAVTYIGQMAFADCANLVTLKLPALAPTLFDFSGNSNWHPFKGCPESRTLGFIDADGVDLTGEALTNAQNKYKAATDGNVTDGLWYGWQITDPNVHALTVNLDGGNGDTTNGNYSTGAQIAINAGTRAGYTFNGWSTTGEGTFADASLASTTFSMPAGATTITASWLAISSVRSFDISGGPIKIENSTTAGMLKVTYGTGQIEDNIDPTDMLTITQVNTGIATANTITVDTASDRTVKITLNGVNIDSSNTSVPAFAIQNNSVVNLTLTASNILKSGADQAGLQVQTKGDKTATITIGGTGTLHATGGMSSKEDFTGGGAGIGGNQNGAGGNISITGGTVTATCAPNGGGAGIGGGDGSPGGTIIISGGIVMAEGGFFGGAGIGGGRQSSGGSISISGTADVTAKGGNLGGAGIGGGQSGAGGIITISDGTVRATGYLGGGSAGGAGIGGGVFGAGGNITITGGNVTAIGGQESAGIGGGLNGATEIIQIDDGATVIAVSKGGKSAIDALGIIESSGSGKTVANILMANYANEVALNTATTVKNGTTEVVKFEPISAYKSIAYTLPAGSYTVYKGETQQTHSDSANKIFEISTAGLNTFSNVKDDSGTSPGPQTYTVIFMGGEGATGIAPTQVATAENGTFGLPANPFVKSGYTFVGWNDGTNNYNTEDTYIMPASNVTLTAQWVANVPNVHTVSGTIKDSNNNPVPGATVTLTDKTDSTKKYTGITDANGNYSIPGVPDGDYTVTVTKASETLGDGDIDVNGGDVTDERADITVTTAQIPVFSSSNVRGIEAITQPASAALLTVTAAVTDGGTLTYQWYENTTNSTTTGTPISGATSSSYTPLTDSVGTTYYYVVITNTVTLGGKIKTSTNTSSIKKVIVLAEPANIYDLLTNGSSLSNVTLDSTNATQYQNYTTTLRADSGYTLPASITVKMGGVTLVPGVDYIYTKTSATIATITVYNVTGELSITAVGVLIPTQTYTLTFNTNGGSNVTALSGIYGTLISLPSPTKTGFNFNGWFRDSSFATSYLSNTMGKENITLHAKWEQITYTVTGNVKNEDNTDANAATVKLMAGSRQIVQATTDSTGNFSINGVPSGIYNLVISKGTDQIITLTITVSDSNIATGSVTLPKGNKNSIVEVKSGTPDIVVDKLNDYFESNKFTQEDKNVVDTGGTVEIKLTVEMKTESGDNEATDAGSITTAAGSGNEIGIFLDLSLSKVVTPASGGTAEQPIPITELESPLTIDIPLPAHLQGKSNYVIYRYHGTTVQTITQTNVDGEYIVVSADGKSLKLYTKKFSTYAIGYKAATTSSGDSDSSTPATPGISSEGNSGGKVIIAPDEKTVTITPDEGYTILDVLVDGKSVGAITTYTFKDGQQHKIKVLFVKETGVVRLAGLNRVDTALAIAKATYQGKVANVILATAENYPDAQAGSVLASKLKAPILLVGSSEVDQQKVIDYLLTSLDSAGEVYILGGTAAVSKAMEAKVTASGCKNITRLGGKNQYETSAIIADQLRVKTGTSVVLVTGENYADAISISSIAGIMQSPILIVQKDGISEEVKQKITAIQPKNIYIIGLESVVSTTVENLAAKTASLDPGDIIRIGGTNRYETSLAVAKYFDLDGKNVCLATGSNFPDALAGSAFATAFNAPILLVEKNLSANQINYLQTKKMNRATLFGGETVITKDIEHALRQLMNK